MDERIWLLLDESVVGRAVSSVTSPFEKARGESRFCAWLRAASATGAVERMRFVGIMVTSAAIFHFAMMSMRATVGWWWLLLPSIALTFGLLAIGISMSAGKSR